MYADADAALDFLLSTSLVNNKDIFLFGHSLGGAVAIDLASRRGKEVRKLNFRLMFADDAPPRRRNAADLMLQNQRSVLSWRMPVGLKLVEFSISFRLCSGWCAAAEGTSCGEHVYFVA